MRYRQRQCLKGLLLCFLFSLVVTVWIYVLYNAPPYLAEPVGAFHNSANLNLAKRRLCAALGISLGSSEHCCAISVARVRAALTASIPRSNRPLARRTNLGAAKSCSLVIIFMIRPPTAQSGKSHYAHRSRPYHGSRNSGNSERPTGHATVQAAVWWLANSSEGTVDAGNNQNQGRLAR